MPGLGRRLGWAAAALTVGATGAALAAARRERISLRGWLVGRVVVPGLFSQHGLDAGTYRLAIADDRARGPALPTRTMRRRYRFSDRREGGVRVLRLAPKAGATTPLRVFYLHGGAYVMDMGAVQWRMVTGLVDRTGAEVVVPLYPLAPEHRVGEGLAAVEGVYRTLVEAAGADSVVMIGDSAGGGLALALAHRLRDAGAHLPAALILLFPWLDATLSGADQPALQADDPLLSIPRLREAGAMWAGDGDPAAPAASPLFAAQSGLPPTLVLVGTHDVLLSDSRRFAARCPAVTLHEYPGMFHGWTCAPIPEAARALDQVATFAATQVGAQ